MSLVKIFLILINVIYIVINYTSADFESLRVTEGFPNGFLSDCELSDSLEQEEGPGFTKQAKIIKSSLKYLIFVHFSNGDFVTAKRTNYNFYQMKELARKMDFRKKTVVYMNGYLDSAVHFPYSSMIGAAYAQLGYNVLLLDYNWFTIMAYPRAARFLKPVGSHTAEMLANLTTNGLDPKKLELVGLSLGGHGVGIIAKNYRHLTARNISRVTALDPAGPCFRHVGPDDRVDASDADFVDVIHCNNEGYGMATAIGHVDYYINGGEYQSNDISELPCSNLCSHLKSFSLWISILQHPYQFKAIKCETIQDARDKNCYSDKPVTNFLGLKADRNVTGIFYLTTLNYYPYCMGEKGLKRENDPTLKYFHMINSEDMMTI